MPQNSTLFNMSDSQSLIQFMSFCSANCFWLLLRFSSYTLNILSYPILPCMRQHTTSFFLYNFAHWNYNYVLNIFFLKSLTLQDEWYRNWSTIITTWQLMGGNCLVYMCYCYWFFDLIVHEVYMISRTYITGASYLFVCSFITNFQYTDIIHLEEGLSARGFDVIRLNTYNTVIFLIFLSTT